MAVASRARQQSGRARPSLSHIGDERGTSERRTVLGGGMWQRGRAISMSVTATPPPRRAVSWFDRWVAQSMPVGAAVLNIGAGANRSGELQRVRERAGRLVGVDPSDQLRDNRQVDERYQQSLEQFARGHAREFDVAFSVFVVEHVADPDGFARSAARVLKPGGTLMGLTVNKWHYFGLTTWAATRLGVCEWLLTRVRDDVDYHYPTEYRWNTVGAMSRVLSRAGFSSVEFRMWDLPALYTPYLPAPVVGVASLWNRVVYRLDQPRLMGNLTFRAIL
jgi:SAM-dependent methyltransferase